LLHLHKISSSNAVFIFYYHFEILVYSPIYVKVNYPPHSDGLSGHGVDFDIIGQLPLQYLADRISQDNLLLYLSPQVLKFVL
jgi:hypothetical protein